MSSKKRIDILRCFKALADETRLRIVSISRRFELNVNEIVETLEMGQSRISRHLKILADAGLLVARRSGLWTFYSTVKEGDAGRFLESITSLFEFPVQTKQDLQRAGAVSEKRIRETQLFFDTVAGSWSEMKREIFGSIDLEKTIIEWMPKGGTSADLGCGSGDLLPLLRHKASYVIGVDRSPRMLEEARKRFFHEKGKGTIELRLGELEHLPMRESEVSSVVINMALHHLQEPEKGIAEAFRVLQPKGMLLVVELADHQLEIMRTRYGDRWLGFDSSVLETWISNQGFRIRKKVEFTLLHGLRALFFLCIKK